MTNDTLLARSNAVVFAKAEEVRNSLYALNYHIAAPSGWINDPNGLVRSCGRWHVFYQHYPYEPKHGPMHWGHASSADLAHWRHEPIAIAPDQPYETGCFSGSAVDNNGVLTLIYTSHHDTNAIKETQSIARSFDGGRTFVKSPLNPVIPTYPEGCSPDFRDPKVWKQDGKWQVVIGTRHGENGCAVLYSSDDLEHWEYRGIMCESDGTQGDMWECPSFCTVDGQDLLIASPMNMPGHKNIAMFGHFDCASGKMVQHHYQELDLGEDFYAAQVLDNGDRTLMFGWMDMWNRPYPTQKDGWAGALTLPRELHVKNGRLLQFPPKELEALRNEKLLDSAEPSALSSVTETSLEIAIKAASAIELALSDEDGECVRVCMNGNRIAFSSRDGRDVDAPLILPAESRDLRVFVDRCSVEVFANGGEVVYSRRIYPKNGKLAYALSGDCRVTAWPLHAAFGEATC